MIFDARQSCSRKFSGRCRRLRAVRQRADTFSGSRGPPASPRCSLKPSRANTRSCVFRYHFPRSPVLEGLEAAASKGNVGGRPSVVDDDTLAVARARHAKGDSVTAIAKALGIGRATLCRHLGESA
ncbi:helix-turn-helix domain-containing protein [Streptomyces xanthophaeus]|uniref:helix-turn-helix domain-containing protein n=1 Tax=Streptomyces xanthophaeus TaxID=67385 RepID=UPI003460E0D0